MRGKAEKRTRTKTKAISLSTLESLETKKITMSSSNKQLKIAQIAPLMESVPPRLYGGTDENPHGQGQGNEMEICQVPLLL